MTWNDISGQYSGLMFRTEGNQSKPFGQIQEQSVGKRLSAINSYEIKDKISEKRIDIRPGIWSNNITLGLYRNKKDSIGLRVKTINNSFTPLNTRLWLWKAINDNNDISLPDSFNDTINYLSKYHDHIDHIALPIGYLYPQLPHQSSPPQLWPSFNWSDISSQYSDHFFRVVVTQTQTSLANSTLSSLCNACYELETVNHLHHNNPLTAIPVTSDGQWTRCLLSGTYGGVWVGLRLRFTSTEWRPINTAIRLWKRN